MDNRASSESPTAPMGPPPEKAGLLDDLMEIFYAPSKVFARREKSGYAMMLVVVTVVSALFLFASRGVFAQIMDAEMQKAAAKALAQNPKIPVEQLNSMMAIQAKVITALSYVGVPIAVFVLGLLTWVASMVFKARITYAQACLIVTFSWIPNLLGGLIGAIQNALMDTSNVLSPYAMSLSVARFMDYDMPNQKVLALLGRVDVFAIWYAVLLAIGISVIAKVPRGKGYAVSAALFALGSLPALFK